jgi:cytochrome c oxidase cbb3-type subunit 3
MSEDKTPLDDDKIIEGYEYDGITELDNPCPKWLMYIFYFTAFLAVFFLGYHFGSSSKNKIVESYMKKLKDAQSQRTTVVVEQVPEVSESELAALLQEPTELASGEEFFVDKCAICHGQAGEGLIGPNLIDNYWIHGTGKISEIAITIRSGIPDKGMVAWQGRIPEENILQIAAYVKSLKGNQVEGAKEPDGKLIED